ncbi:hypothetical protein Tco_0797387 [Tanacetum coccineum]
MIVIMSMIELNSLSGPLFDEYFNRLNQVVSKSSAVTTADASDKRQQKPDSTSSTSTLATTVTADGNFEFVLGISISISIFKISCNETVSNKEKIDLKKSHHRFFPVDTSLILVKSHKSPTKSLFDVGSSRISIFIVKNHRFTRMFWQYHKDNA